MAKIRGIRKIFKSIPTIEGAGVHLKRAFGFSEVPIFDPFLLLDNFGSDNPENYLKGFPWHPHRGIETITYVLNGVVAHGDSLGNEDIISSGDVQWMTAGSGIIHQEMPRGDQQNRMRGFQLWANLPRSQKMMDPRYRGLKAEEIPEIRTNDDIRIKIMCGKVGDVTGPVEDIVIDPEYLDIQIPPHSQYTHPTQSGYTVFAYVFEGKGYFCPEKSPFTHDMQGSTYFDMQMDPLLGEGSLVLFEDGEEIVISSENDAVRLLLISGKPLCEPVAWYGPIVMNTREELQLALEEFQKGTFVKKDHP
jgi:redox-sensitive bicupin YhaK (pirin superfamily)